MKRTILALALLASPAAAQEPCFPYKDVARAFKQETGQVPRMRALSSDGLVYEILANEKGEWLLIVVYPSGEACGRALGDVVVWIKPGVPG